MSFLRNRLITRAVETFGLDSDDEYRKAAAFVDHVVDGLEADLEAERFEASHLREERDGLLNVVQELITLYVMDAYRVSTPDAREALVRDVLRTHNAAHLVDHVLIEKS